ncbi:MAG TPA: ribosome silencing factor [Spirochaetota bacterium]|nr:ribosome silencing factor [Spirochaetota bacterium]
MSEIDTQEDVFRKAREVAEFLVEKKANNVVCIDISSLTSMADCFIMADVEVQLQVDSLRSQIVDLLSAQGIHARNAVNAVQQGWALLDYNGFIVHIFLTELREYYGLEKIWGEGKKLFP